jgi:hypothetical protein
MIVYWFRPKILGRRVCKGLDRTELARGTPLPSVTACAVVFPVIPGTVKDCELITAIKR